MDLEKILQAPKKKRKEISQLHLDVRKICPMSALFDVPHQAEPMTAREIAIAFSEFAKEMDGSYRENSLCHFYKLNKERRVYEFIDTDAEEEVAELMEVSIYDEEKAAAAAEQETDKPEDRPLTEEERQLFREHISDIREKLDALRAEKS